MFARLVLRCSLPPKLNPSCRPDFKERPAVRILHGIAEEGEEEGLGEQVELGECGTALGPQRDHPVQHFRDPPLLRQRREREREFKAPVSVEV